MKYFVECKIWDHKTHNQAMQCIKQFFQISFLISVFRSNCRLLTRYYCVMDNGLFLASCLDTRASVVSHAGSDK